MLLHTPHLHIVTLMTVYRPDDWTRSCGCVYLAWLGVGQQVGLPGVSVLVAIEGRLAFGVGLLALVLKLQFFYLSIMG